MTTAIDLGRKATKQTNDPEFKLYLYVNDSIIVFYHNYQGKKGGKDQEMQNKYHT